MSDEALLLARRVMMPWSSVMCAVTATLSAGANEDGAGGGMAMGYLTFLPGCGPPSLIPRRRDQSDVSADTWCSPTVKGKRQLKRAVRESRRSRDLGRKRRLFTLPVVLHD